MGLRLGARVRRACDLLGFEGVPLRAIQRITGHVTLVALERYLDIGSAEAYQSQAVVMGQLFT